MRQLGLTTEPFAGASRYRFSIVLQWTPFLSASLPPDLDELFSDRVRLRSGTSSIVLGGINTLAFRGGFVENSSVGFRYVDEGLQSFWKSLDAAPNGIGEAWFQHISSYSSSRHS